MQYADPALSEVFEFYPLHDLCAWVLLGDESMPGVLEICCQLRELRHQWQLYHLSARLLPQRPPLLRLHQRVQQLQNRNHLPRLQQRLHPRRHQLQQLRTPHGRMLSLRIQQHL